MEKLKIEDLKKVLIKENYNNIDIGCLCDYNPTTYLYDTFYEIAEANADIYNSDLLKWLCDNYEKYEDYIREYDVDNKDFDLIRTIMGAQCISLENELRENAKEYMLYYIYYMIEENYPEITENDEDILNEVAENFVDEEILPAYNEIIEKWEEIKEERGEE